MVGNDIVDIAEARVKSNWQRPRFLNKLFTELEKETIFQSNDPFITVWHLWSMKEAAYKLYNQLNPYRFYNPKGFECSYERDHGIVRYKNFFCFTLTKITSDYVLSEAQMNPFEFGSHVIEFENKDVKEQGKNLKAHALKWASKKRILHQEKLILENSEHGIPTINTPTKILPLSLTHHGRFGAFVVI